MPEVFANTTPLQYLHRIGRLEWLRDFYGRIVVPVAVVKELKAGQRLAVRVPDLSDYPWIEIRAMPDPLPKFPGFIHRGEAEVLALAQVANSALVVIDDLLARKHAQDLGLRVTGTLGVILRARRE